MTRPLESHADLVRLSRAVHETRAAPSVAAASAPAEVTVSMPARNARRYVGPALRSVLAQEGITVEVVVVDDASEDDTAAEAERVGDRRVTVLRNERHLGIGACHNRALAASSAPFVTHVDADDFIAPSALRTMVDALRDVPDAAQSYCNHLLVAGDGTLSEREFIRQREALSDMRRRMTDVRRALLAHGMVTNTLRTYRRDALARVGPFNEHLPWAVDYDMAIRLADTFEMVYVPDFLYLQRVHGDNTQQIQSHRALKSWRMRAAICRRELRERNGRLLGRSSLALHGLLLIGLLDAVRGSLTGSGSDG